MQAFTHWFIIDEQWMAEKPGLQAFTHWFIIDEQWMAEKPGLQAFTTGLGLQRNQAFSHTGLL